YSKDFLGRVVPCLLPIATDAKTAVWIFAAQLFSSLNVATYPLLPAKSDIRKAFANGETDTINAILDNIPLVSADLGWKHVLAFREDPEAIRKYRSLKLWLSDGLKAKSHQEAVDFIGAKLDDYQWALKKHGLNTKLGSLTTILDSKHLTVPAIGSAVAYAVSSPMWALVAGGFLATSNVALSIAKNRLKLDDFKRENAAVATIYEIKQLATSGKR
ncbi:MAG: hypothetical protein NTV51_24850, partial [Verrucomicrobia bacterium]|nr:hypothetical protein [Verrucomicrobiota bacterium]